MEGDHADLKTENDVNKTDSDSVISASSEEALFVDENEANPEVEMRIPDVPVSEIVTSGDSAPASSGAVQVEDGNAHHLPDDVSASSPSKPRLFLEFDAIQSEPPFERIFLSSGGSISSAASRHCTDFALTGASTSSKTYLTDKFATSVRVELNPDHFTINDDTPMTATVSNRFKLLATTTRLGSAINGSIVTSVAGQGAAYLSSLLRSGASAASVPLKYGKWASHSAVVGVSGFRLVDDENRHYNINFKKDTQHDSILKNAEKVLEVWADGSFKMRKSSFVYKPSPALTKTVAKVPVGINDSGYAPLHDFGPANRHGYSYSTIDSLFEQGVQADLEFVQEDVEQFLQDTSKPGLLAAQNGGRSVSAAVSLIANALIPYRADGRTAIMPNGSSSVSSEFWNFERAKSKLGGDDCDASAGLGLGILEAAAKAPAEVRAKYKFLNAVHNVLNPFYTIGLSVLGASSAEASGGGGGKGGSGKSAHVAGHAVTLIIPTIDVLGALEKGSKQTLGGKPVVDDDMQSTIAQARFESVFSAESIQSLSEEDRAMLSSWDAAKKHLEDGNLNVEAFACEGTTPASPILFRSGEAGEIANQTAAADKKAFKKVGPTIGRSVKILHSGENGDHHFYRDFVELTLSRDHPLWASHATREVGAASTQFVFSRHDGLSGSHPVVEAGASPKEVATRSYALVPLVVADKTTSDILDYASMHAEHDSMPVGQTMHETLSAFQTSQLEKSLGYLDDLNQTLRRRMDTSSVSEVSEANTHAIAHVVSVSSLVNNPNGIQHLAKTIEQNAVSGVVDVVPIRGLLVDANGNDAARLVLINSVVQMDDEE